ncbi:MAG TPA: MarR family winged helix-turn-helix transcriptional regulator [Gemmatimonadaceae bacterium]|jgi:DNA-binding MarR family transcriptional regulator|nr:MarR family winged helix-turn-helix transcriptional regulator [Gemmatimonadaceae bacterium]
MLDADVRALLDAYPRIYFACHRRHVRDPKSGKALSAHQASILDHLDSVEPTSLNGLAAHMGVTPSTMSIAIDRLVRRRYVERARDPQDGRRVHLRLTENGERIKQASSVLDPARVRDLLRHLSPAERNDGLRGLALLARAAGQSMEARRGTSPRRSDASPSTHGSRRSA